MCTPCPAEEEEADVATSTPTTAPVFDAAGDATEVPPTPEPVPVTAEDAAADAPATVAPAVGETDESETTVPGAETDANAEGGADGKPHTSGPFSHLAL